MMKITIIFKNLKSAVESEFNDIVIHELDECSSSSAYSFSEDGITKELLDEFSDTGAN